MDAAGAIPPRFFISQDKAARSGNDCNRFSGVFRRDCALNYPRGKCRHHRRPSVLEHDPEVDTGLPKSMPSGSTRGVMLNRNLTIAL